jgi:hypothetical protein
MKYTYLLLCLFVLLLLVVLLLRRRDLIRLAMSVGVIGGVAGLIAELFYYRDYWRPPTTLGIAKISPEDFLFGFAIAGVSVIAYPVIFGKRLTTSPGLRRGRLYLLFFLCAVAGMIVFNLVLGINSIVVSSVIFLLSAAAICCLRWDLIKPALYSSILITIALLLIYVLLFDVISPHFWDQYWLLRHTRLNLMVFGHVPLTELVWYFSWSSLGSIIVPFVRDLRFEQR